MHTYVCFDDEVVYLFWLMDVLHGAEQWTWGFYSPVKELAVGQATVWTIVLENDLRCFDPEFERSTTRLKHVSFSERDDMRLKTHTTDKCHFKKLLGTTKINWILQ